MGISDKLAAQASTKLGEPVVAAAMIVPPGATLYKAYSPKSKAAGAGGPIVEALLSKQQGSVDGDAGTVPTVRGQRQVVLPGTGDRIRGWIELCRLR